MAPAVHRTGTAEQARGASSSAQSPEVHRRSPPPNPKDAPASGGERAARAGLRRGRLCAAASLSDTPRRLAKHGTARSAGDCRKGHGRNAAATSPEPAAPRPASGHRSGGFPRPTRRSEPEGRAGISGEGVQRPTSPTPLRRWPPPLVLGALRPPALAAGARSCWGWARRVCGRGHGGGPGQAGTEGPCPDGGPPSDGGHSKAGLHTHEPSTALSTTLDARSDRFPHRWGTTRPQTPAEAGSRDPRPVPGFASGGMKQSRRPWGGGPAPP